MATELNPVGIPMVIELLGGLSFFLLGMEGMSQALRKIAGDRLRSLLGRLTTNRFSGVATGAVVTALIQSSSVTTVLTVGFVSAGLISLQQSIGIIFGAEIGTTLTAQIIAFKVTKFSLPMVTVGFAIALLGRSEQIRQGGRALIGLGMIFFGMQMMSSAMYPLRNHQPFLDLMSSFSHPLTGILLAAGFTALIQSSSATTGLVIVMATQGVINLQAGVALILGANIGTCVTALLAAIGKPREAVRTALVHLMFNMSGVLLWAVLIGVENLAALAAMVSPVSEGVVGMEKLAEETPRQIANAHTIFNVLNSLFFIGFVGQFARFTTWLVPESKWKSRTVTPVAVKESFLDQRLLDTPSQALDTVRREIAIRMGKPLMRMYGAVLPAVLDKNQNALMVVAEMDQAVDLAYSGIIEYLGHLGEQPLNEMDSGECTRLMDVANHLENIGDIIETNLVHLGRQRLQKGVQVSTQTRGVIGRFHSEVEISLDTCLQSVIAQDKDMARSVIQLKPVMQKLVSDAATHQARRLSEGSGGMAAYALEMDIYDKFNRIYYHAKKVAQDMAGSKKRKKVPKSAQPE